MVGGTAVSVEVAVGEGARVELGSMDAVSVGGCATIVGGGLGASAKIELPRLSTLKITTRLMVNIDKR